MEDLEHYNVLTLNTWGILYISKDIDTRMAFISEELAKGKYQLVHLQEVWAVKNFEVIRDKVKGALPYSHYFHSGLIGSGCATFSKYPILDAFFHKYSHNGYFWDVLHGDWFGGKGVGCIVIKHPKKKVYSFNTHLHADYPGDQCDTGLEECRMLQSYQLAQFVKQVTRPGDAFVVSGDMNHPPESLGIKVIKSLVELNDTFEIASSKPEECNTIDLSNMYVGAGETTSRIDYIFTSEAFECLSCGLAMQQIPNHSLPFSDHEGYTATLQFKERNDVTVMTSEYEDDQSTRSVLQQLLKSVTKGENIANTIHWKKFYPICLLFSVLIILPILSVDVFHTVFPPVSTWLGKGVFIFQVISVVVSLVYLWVVTYVRVCDSKAFSAVSSEISTRLRALDLLVDDRKMK